MQIGTLTIIKMAMWLLVNLDHAYILFYFFDFFLVYNYNITGYSIYDWLLK